MTGMRPQFFKDMLLSGDLLASSLLEKLSKLVDLILRGEVPDVIRPLLFGASLTALAKKDGGIRPIAVGDTSRRIVCKVVSHRLKDAAANLFRPIQLGFGTKGGAEAAVHATRYYLEHRKEEVMLKIDICNAFNTVHRSAFIDAVDEHFPSYSVFIRHMYSDSSLLYGNRVLSSETGVQQGDPLGPLLFCLAIHSSVSQLSSPLNVWYLDDGTLVGPPDVILSDVQTLVSAFQRLGLSFNTSKSELFAPSFPDNDPSIYALTSALPGLTRHSSSTLSLLGSPLTHVATPVFMERKKEEVMRLLSRLDFLSTHRAFYVLTHCWGIPKLMYLLRTAPFIALPDLLKDIDAQILSALIKTTNVRLEGSSLIQAVLPVRLGGLGMRRLQDLALSAYASSVHSCSSWIQDIIPTVCSNGIIDKICEVWCEAGFPLPEDEKRKYQPCWDHIVMDHLQNLLKEDASLDMFDNARLLATAAPESSSWLQAYPLPSLGTELANHRFRIAVALRVGADICKEHKCRCGKTADKKGLHALSCSFQSGRLPRHAEINGIIKGALVTAGFQAKLEPRDTEPGSRRRPDGITQIPFWNGKPLAWDATVRDTNAITHLPACNVVAGAAADLAEREKVAKYQEIFRDYHFVPLGFETFGSWGAEAKELVTLIGRKIVEISGERRALSFLRQRISLAI